MKFYREAFAVRGACSTPYTHFQSQRDCVLQPRVARNELPWGIVPGYTTLKGLSLCRSLRTRNSSCNPFRVESTPPSRSQGSSFHATLSFVTESLWDSRFGPAKKMRVRCRSLLPLSCPPRHRQQAGRTPHASRDSAFPSCSSRSYPSPQLSPSKSNI